MKTKTVIVLFALFLVLFQMPVHAEEISYIFDGVWVLEYDKVFNGGVMGYILADDQFIGYAFNGETPYFISADLKNGLFSGYIEISGVHLLFSGLYFICHSLLICRWVCHVFSGLIIGRLR